MINDYEVFLECYTLPYKTTYASFSCHITYISTPCLLPLRNVQMRECERTCINAVMFRYMCSCFSQHVTTARKNVDLIQLKSHFLCLLIFHFSFFLFSCITPVQFVCIVILSELYTVNKLGTLWRANGVQNSHNSSTLLSPVHTNSKCSF